VRASRWASWDADLKLRHHPGGLFVKNRRALSGSALLLTAGVLLAAFSAELHTAFQNLFLFAEKDTFAFHVLFIGLLIVGCLTSILPASILGVFAGAFFGIVEGFLISAGSFLVAAVAAFSFSRYFFRASSRRLAGKVINLETLEENLQKFGWKYALLLRLTPIAPFGVMSYGLGLTPIKMRHYVLTTFGTFPFLFACVFRPCKRKPHRPAWGIRSPRPLDPCPAVYRRRRASCAVCVATASIAGASNARNGPCAGTRELPRLPIDLFRPPISISGPRK
jgi:uncharacterized membrane protein YdjX (TVP38/TMEM64 family)